MLNISNLSLTIPTTRNHHFHVYVAIIILVSAGISFIIESICNHLFYGYVRGCCPSSDYSIHQESSLSYLWRQYHVGYCWPPSYYSIHQETLLLQYMITMITLGVVGLLLTIPSTKNIFFHSMVNLFYRTVSQKLEFEITKQQYVL